MTLHQKDNNELVDDIALESDTVSKQRSSNRAPHCFVCTPSNRLAVVSGLAPTSSQKMSLNSNH